MLTGAVIGCTKKIFDQPPLPRRLDAGLDRRFFSTSARSPSRSSVDYRNGVRRMFSINSSTDYYNSVRRRHRVRVRKRPVSKQRRTEVLHQQFRRLPYTPIGAGVRFASESVRFFGRATVRFSSNVGRRFSINGSTDYRPAFKRRRADVLHQRFHRLIQRGQAPASGSRPKASGFSDGATVRFRATSVGGSPSTPPPTNTAGSGAGVRFASESVRFRATSGGCSPSTVPPTNTTGQAPASGSRPKASGFSDGATVRFRATSGGCSPSTVPPTNTTGQAPASGSRPKASGFSDGATVRFRATSDGGSPSTPHRLLQRRQASASGSRPKASGFSDGATVRFSSNVGRRFSINASPDYYNGVRRRRPVRVRFFGRRHRPVSSNVGRMFSINGSTD